MEIVQEIKTTNSGMDIRLKLSLDNKSLYIYTSIGVLSKAVWLDLDYYEEIDGMPRVSRPKTIKKLLADSVYLELIDFLKKNLSAECSFRLEHILAHTASGMINMLSDEEEYNKTK